jgi:hypothetical protein
MARNNVTSDKSPSGLLFVKKRDVNRPRVMLIAGPPAGIVAMSLRRLAVPQTSAAGVSIHSAFRVLRAVVALCRKHMFPARPGRERSFGGTFLSLRRGDRSTHR